MMNEDNIEELGQVIDSIDNLAHALKLNMPAHIHVEALREALPDKVKELKRIFTEITGQNPWL